MNLDGLSQHFPNYGHDPKVGRTAHGSQGKAKLDSKVSLKIITNAIMSLTLQSCREV